MPLGFESGTATRPYRFGPMCNLYSLPLTKAAIILRLRELAPDIDFTATAALRACPLLFRDRLPQTK
jgi:hypothetical protein